MKDRIETISYWNFGKEIICEWPENDNAIKYLRCRNSRLTRIECDRICEKKMQPYSIHQIIRVFISNVTFQPQILQTVYRGWKHENGQKSIISGGKSSLSLSLFRLMHSKFEPHSTLFHFWVSSIDYELFIWFLFADKNVPNPSGNRFIFLNSPNNVVWF